MNNVCGRVTSQTFHSIPFLSYPILLHRVKLKLCFFHTVIQLFIQIHMHCAVFRSIHPSIHASIHSFYCIVMQCKSFMYAIPCHPMLYPKTPKSKDRTRRRVKKSKVKSRKPPLHHQRASQPVVELYNANHHQIRLPPFLASFLSFLDKPTSWLSGAVGCMYRIYRM